MKIRNIKSAYFSPTGTSKAVVEAIVCGIGPDTVAALDITSPKARNEPLRAADDDLLVMAVPVYMGRVPALLGDWLSAIQADGTPAVCVVVYGNREFDDALLELKDILKSRGCTPIAGAAYIGEHSFSTSDRPVAHGRPNTSDLQHAKAFGEKIRVKLESFELVSAIPEVEIPGTSPYGGITQLWDVDFIEVGSQCTQCGLCAKVCPVGAVASDDSRKIDQQKCITCCACIKNCPQQARTIKASPVMDASQRLHSNFRKPRQPVYFL